MSVSGATTTATVTGLTGAAGYTFHVAAVNAVGTSPDAVSNYLRIPCTLCGLPSLPAVLASTQPTAVVAAPFTGTGRADVAVLSAAGGVTVAQHQLSGTFFNLSPLSTGPSPVALQAGDVDGDGTPDLAIACAGDDTVDLYQSHVGVGGGNYNPSATILSTGRDPTAMAIADVNADGYADILVATSLDGGLTVISGATVGSAPAPNLVTVENGATAIAAGNFDGDAFNDVALLIPGGNHVAVSYSNGALGALSAPLDLPTCAAPADIATGDLNGDGLDDIVVSCPGASQVDVLLTSGGTFQAAVPYPTNHPDQAVRVADLNGDGNLDVALSSSSDGTVDVLLGSGLGTLGTPASFAAGSNLRGLAVAFLDGDAFPDLATANFTYNSTSTVSMLHGFGDGTFPTFQSAPAANFDQSPIVGDFDENGLPDVVVANFVAGTVSFFSGNGDGSLAPRLDLAVGTNPSDVAAGDFNGDGHLDIAAANSADGTVSVLLGHGDGTFAAQQVQATGNAPLGIAAGDLNGDGLPDLVTVQNFVGGSADVLLSKGDGTFQPFQTVALDANLTPTAVTLADLDGDGHLDLAVALQGTPGGVGVRLGNGDGTFQPMRFWATSGAPVALAVGDATGDGVPDVVVANGVGVSVLQGQGGGSFLQSVDYDTARPGTSSAVAIGDVNGDGRPDVVAANSNGSVALLAGVSGGTLGQADVFPAPANIKGMALSDLTGDGAPDVIVPGYQELLVLPATCLKP